ncbi:MAG: hypothetical protein AABW52_02155 [Nanoarchaeota archaeon]
MKEIKVRNNLFLISSILIILIVFSVGFAIGEGIALPKAYHGAADIILTTNGQPTSTVLREIVDLQTKSLASKAREDQTKLDIQKLAEIVATRTEDSQIQTQFLTYTRQLKILSSWGNLDPDGMIVVNAVANSVDLDCYVKTKPGRGGSLGHNYEQLNADAPHGRADDEAYDGYNLGDGSYLYSDNWSPSTFINKIYFVDNRQPQSSTTFDGSQYKVLVRCQNEDTGQLIQEKETQLVWGTR